MRIEQTEIDGVPTVWTEAPGPLRATLMFRVGQADEALHRHGATHLIEHLALSAQGQQHLPHNGSVEETITSFVAQGRPDEVAAFLSATTAALADLPWDRRATEIRVLETEAARRGRPAVGTAMAMRYGNRGYGMPGLPELGLHALDVAALDSWRRAWFTRGNAVLSLSGPPPDALDLAALPEGLRHPAPPPVPLARQPFPCWFPGPSGTVLVLLALERTTPDVVALTLATARLRQRLRHEEGRSYGVEGDIQALTATDAHGVIAADCLPEEAAAVRDACVAELHRIALHGPTAEELDDARRSLRRMVEDPGSTSTEALILGRDLLLGRTVRPVADRLAELDAISPNDIASALARALRTAVWIVPRHVPMTDRRIHPVVATSEQVVDGTLLRRPQPVADRHPDRLVVGDDGVMLQWPSDDAVTVRWSEVAAVQRWTDGGRTLWGDDGAVVSIHPEAWTRGVAATALVDERAPGERIVPMPAPLGALDLDPAEPPDLAAAISTPSPSPPSSSPSTGRTALWVARRGIGLVADAVLAAVALLAALVAVGMAVAPNEHMDAATAAFVVAAAGLVAVVFGSTFWRRRVRRARADADDERAAILARTVAASPASGYVPPELPTAESTPWGTYGVIVGIASLAVVVGLVAGDDAGARLALLSVTGGIVAAAVVARRRG